MSSNGVKQRALLFLLAAGLGACGSSSGTGSTPAPQRDSGGGIERFETKGGDNSLQEVGSEAPGPERMEAGRALHGFLDAQAAGAWAAACRYLDPAYAAEAARQFLGPGSNCVALVRRSAAGLPPAARREAAVADIGAFRVNGDAGILFFHGAGGVDFYIPVVRDGGSWKVAAIAPSALP